ncbi:unnamed protein product [Tilletia laevis]|uniref:Uncharacterized protein n=2 Tax=Tilletia TaxID=13289 RepID=A0A177SZ32_9BASI|nr:hypothetical protein CF336_g9670 [Tilletia laevis]KAE8240501.1 hypothetical protein A4X03_0g8507 [Tilletia caries]KAE8180018.1 hypothetical protein CF335_g9392 [Tilletia laevis]CAD6892860.1 unnamed protein product [Tilletia caries]CAD6900749.1 unnamed protein product [Tilletia caries]
MSYTQRLVPIFVASFVGITTGVYVFQPLLAEYGANTHGTFRPEQHDLRLDPQAVDSKNAQGRGATTPSGEDVKAAAVAVTSSDQKTS